MERCSITFPKLGSAYTPSDKIFVTPIHLLSDYLRYSYTHWFVFKTSKSRRLAESLGQLFCGQQLSIKVSFGRGQIGQPIVKILCLRNGCTNRSFQVTVYRPIDRPEFL